MSKLVEIITASDDGIRNIALEAVCRDLSMRELELECQALDQFRKQSENLYERVRAQLFLASIHRYFIPPKLPQGQAATAPYEAYERMLHRRFNEAVEILTARQAQTGPSQMLSSALSQAYRELSFQTLADQVRKSVRAVPGNQWMFRVGHPSDLPLRISPELCERGSSDGPPPLLCESTPVRMDFTHSAWSDIFFLGMDYPSGAKVINASIDLGVLGRDQTPHSPIETYLRVIESPVLRLVSVDLGCARELHAISEVFDLASDYLGLLKSAIIASGIVPPGLEGCGQNISAVMERIVGPGLGLELVSKVNDIPKGSRLAVSTNLLGSLISICMRATRQIGTLEGPLAEGDRRIVAARAILGEWLGGSGGGWQDSGGIWPGVKVIEGVAAAEGDAEYGVSRGRLLPQHEVLGERVSPACRQRLQDSLVLVHGGMAQNVGPILEMVTEKYLLRSEREWQARQAAIGFLSKIQERLEQGDIKAVGQLTTENFVGPLQTIIPWATNQFTDTLIERARKQFGDDFWGFWMLGGMSGGGMGFLFAPDQKAEAEEWLSREMPALKQELQNALPFAMDPVVYIFKINDQGSNAELKSGQDAWMPDAYYALMAPQWIRDPSQAANPTIQRELGHVADRCLAGDDYGSSSRSLLRSLLPPPAEARSASKLEEQLRQFGFDRGEHERIREELRTGRIGLAQNRLAPTTSIENPTPNDVVDCRECDRYADVGAEALRRGEAAVITLAAGAGSRWSDGAGVVKALNPFCKLDGEHRDFLEIHLAKSRKSAKQWGAQHPHVFTTSYLTDRPIRDRFANRNYGYSDGLHISTGRSVGLRLTPTARDLQFLWDMPHQVLDVQQEKVRNSQRQAILQWAKGVGEASDYTDNTPLQCLHPVGHWYEFPNMLRNGVLRDLLAIQPRINWLMLHNIDTLGATLDPALLGLFIHQGACLSYEVIERRIEDRGGGLARVNGQLRLLEGLAMPNDEIEFDLLYYNSLTTWINLDQLLQVFGLAREDLDKPEIVDDAIRRLARRVPTYVTLKDVKKRWGHGQEDIFPVVQFEKLWGDMTALPEVDCRYYRTTIQRGQQLKDYAQLDGWIRDGSSKYVSQRCDWS